MANNRWDFSDILLQQRAGQIMGQAYAGLGQQAGGALKEFGEQKKQNQAMKGEVDSAANFFESATDMVQKKADAEMQANGGKLSDETFKMLQSTQQTLGGLHDPNRSLVERHAMAKSASKNLFDLINLGSATQNAKITEQTQQLNAARLAELSRQQEQQRNQDINLSQVDQYSKGIGRNLLTPVAQANLASQAKSPILKAALEGRQFGVNPDKILEYMSGENKTAAQIEAARAKIPGEQFTQEQGLRSEFNSNIVKKNWDVVSQYYNRGLEFAKTPSAMGDVGLIFALMKVYDPSSTVRESEQASVENARGVPSRVSAMYNNLLVGQKLTEEQRKDIVKQLHTSASEQHKSLIPFIKQLKSVSSKGRLDYDNVVPEEYRTFKIGEPTPPPPPPPENPKPMPLVGEIREGHKFKGGNPYDENNWEKL